MFCICPESFPADCISERNKRLGYCSLIHLQNCSCTLHSVCFRSDSLTTFALLPELYIFRGSYLLKVISFYLVQPSRVSFLLPILEYILFAPGTFAKSTFLDLTGISVTSPAPGMASALLSNELLGSRLLCLGHRLGCVLEALE